MNRLTNASPAALIGPSPHTPQAHTPADTEARQGGRLLSTHRRIAASQMA